jgi:hypothetical protein
MKTVARLAHTEQEDIPRSSIPHMTAAKPPNVTNDPENAQDRSEYISFGVILSWHSFGLEPRGIMNAS